MGQEQKTLPVGSTVRDTFGGHYVVEKLLGKGGNGAVYLVSDRRNAQRAYALKEIIDPTKQERDRLLFERTLLKRLSHPALPRVYHVFEQEKSRRLYLLMQYIGGKNLHVLRKEQPEERFPLQFVLSTLEPIVDALIYVHQQKPPVLHRDIKPSNIIVPADGSNAMLVDFGTAKEYYPDNTTTMFRFGTPGYAPIEQYSPEGLTGIRTDVYGLGATLYALLTGVKPTDAIERVLTKKDKLQLPHTLVPDIPESVSLAILRALSIHYNDRFAKVAEFWQAVHTESEDTDAGEEEESVPALRLGDEPPPALLSEKQQETRTRKRNRISIASFVLLALIVVGLAPFFFFVYPALSTPFSSSTAQKSPVTSISHTPSPKVGTYPYPPLADLYAGTISDIAVAHTTTKLYLMQVHQNQGNFAGTFQGLGLVGPFTGTVTPAGNVHLVIHYGAGSLIFDGAIKIGGDMEGNFYAVDQQERRIGEYGLWYVSAASS